MLIIGSHVSFKSDTQLIGSLEEALSYNANAFMFYTGAPQNTKRCEINKSLLIKFNEMKELNHISIDNIICHAPYIVNLANNLDLSKYEFACNFLRQEIDRCIELGVKKIVLHPGSALTIERNEALFNVINALNSILKSDDDIIILLETMAGKGTELGINIDELKTIIDNVILKDKVGVCLDTCHLYDSGVDLSNFNDYVLEFDSKIGIDKIGCIHINDSKNVLESHKDRHENIGFGTIGFNNLLNIIYDERFENVPKILETPYIDKEYPPYKIEIEMIKSKEIKEELYSEVVNYYKKGV